MPRQRLTLPRIAAFNPNGESFLWDEDVPRLAVRARASGTKSFIFKGTLNYKDVRITIGSTDVWTIEAARDEARRYQRTIDEGKDPREVARQQAEASAANEAARIAAKEAVMRNAERIETPAIKTWQDYIEARRPRWSPRHLSDHQKMASEGGKPRTRGRRTGTSSTTVPGILRQLLLRPLTQIDATAVRAWMKEEAANRPTRTRLAFSLLRAFLNWCTDHPDYTDQVQANACNGRMARDELPKTSARDDCLQREQLSAWFAAVRATTSPVVAAYLQVVLLTGARREEVAGLRWEDIDFTWKSLTIKDKVEGERTIPLTPYVSELLQDLKLRNDTPPPSHRILRGKRIKNDLDAWLPSPWVFSSTAAASGRLQDARAAHVRAIAAAGLPPLSIHGLRRSFGTLSEWCEVPVGVVAQIQGHKPSAIAEKHYRRRPIDLLRSWHTRIEAWILTEAGIKQPKKDTKPGLRAVAK